MDKHVAYQAVPIDLNEYFLPSDQSLLPTFDGNGNGNRNNRVDDGNRTKLYLLGGLAVALILSLAIVLPLLHPCQNLEQLRLVKTFLPNEVRHDQQGEPHVLVTPTLRNVVINQEERSSNNNTGPIDVDKVISDDESLFWKNDYLGDDEGVFDLVDYLQEEVGELHSELVFEHPGNVEVHGQDRHLEDKDDDSETFSEYNDGVPLNDDEFEAYEDAFALGIKADAVPKRVEGESDDTDLKAYDKESGSEDTPDCDRVDGLYQGDNIAVAFLRDDDTEPEELAYA